MNLTGRRNETGGVTVIIAANWKMNPPLGEAGMLAAAYAAAVHEGITRVLFPPAPYLVQMAMRLEGSGIRLGGQDCHEAASGAHTGDVAASMLASCGAGMVLLGHSSGARRTEQLEYRRKGGDGAAEGLSVMICVGETLGQREAGNAEVVVTAQLDGSVPEDIAADRLMLAYEPVWAIGTGKVAGVDEIASMHAAIRAWLAGRGMSTVPVLYGGSVKPDNADAIFAVPDVDGALVGGASLKADDFDAICAAGTRAAAARE